MNRAFVGKLVAEQLQGLPDEGIEGEYQLRIVDNISFTEEIKDLDKIFSLRDKFNQASG